MGSDFLFAMPSALSGAARSLDLSATFDEYNVSSTEREADMKALCADWYVVGDSLLDAINSFGSDKPEVVQQALEFVET